MNGSSASSSDNDAPVDAPAGRPHPYASVWRFWLPLLAFVTLTVVGVLRHEPWRDEADTWLVARDGTLSSTLAYLRHGGTPGLWYILLIPFAKLGLPFATQAWINGAIACLAAALCLRLAPFPAWMRWLAVFSFYPAFQYAIVARSYALSMLLLLVVGALWARRFAAPGRFGLSLALLANTNVHGLLLAGVFGSLHAIERGAARRLSRDNLVALLLCGIGGLLAVAQILPDANSYRMVPVRPDIPFNLSQLLRNAIVPANFLPWSFAPAMCLVLNVAGVVCTVVACSRRPRVLAFYVAAISVLTAFLVFGYYGGLHHAGTIALVTVTAWWMLGSEAAPGPAQSPVTAAARVILACALAASCLATALTFRLEYRFAFSGAKDMGRYLRENDLAQRPIAAYPDPIGASVLVHLPRRELWYAGREASGSYTRWDRAHYANRYLAQEQVLQRIERAFPDAPDLLLLLNRPIENAATRGYRLLYQTRIPVFLYVDERYWLYERSKP